METAHKKAKHEYRSSGPPGVNEIVKLNVCGELMTTTRSTLCAVEGSLLASMFSGRWEGSLTRDEEGRVFLDFEPVVIRPIIDYLRLKRIEDPSEPVPFPSVRPDLKDTLEKVAAYLGLNEGTSDSFRRC
jgi:hypothetical protein